MKECEDREKSCFDFVSKDPTIELEPFIHQVGGRSAILVLGDYICKLANEREVAFYEAIDRCAPLLKPFVPQFNGVISVNFAESNDGYLIITTKSSSLHDTSALNQTNEQPPPPLVSSVPHTPSANILQSPNSPYQKFVTKYRVKLCRPLREIIIESHEQDIENDVSLDLENSKRQLETFLSKNKNAESGHNSAASISPQVSYAPTSLSRSRSTSISIPNFEDAGQNGFSPNGRKSSSPKFSRQSSGQLSPSRKVAFHYNKSTTKHNPWVLKTFAALSEFNDSMKEQRFIMLENLVTNFEYPCIMDLKMGTRLHDDNATETKKQSHESKVNDTTSGALGLRITGIQIYDKNMDKFICYNKYYGRKLTPESFRESLKKFVSNENFVAHNLLDRLIERLKRLRSVIVELDTFRFYTSSLLLIFEGNTCKVAGDEGISNSLEGDLRTSFVHDPDKLLDVRVIDFAHSTYGQHINTSTISGDDSTRSHDYDEGFVFGLDNLIKILTLFKTEQVSK